MLLTLDDDIGAQTGNDLRNTLVHDKGIIDPTVALDAFQTKLLRYMGRIAGHPVALNRYDEAIAAFLGESQEAQVSGVKDIEVAGDKDGFFLLHESPMAKDLGSMAPYRSPAWG